MENNICYVVFIDGHSVAVAEGTFCIGELFDIVERLDSTERAVDVLDWTSECEIGAHYYYDDWSVLCSTSR